MHDVDAAGVIFFSNVLKLAHDCYEAFLTSKGLSIQKILTQKKYVIPIVHGEVNLLKPLVLSMQLSIGIKKIEISKHSFSLTYQFIEVDSKQLLSECKTTHVTIDKKTGKKIELPQEIVKTLT